MNIYQKLIEVRKEVPYLQKESKGYQFNYTGSSLVLGSLKTKMDELGLLLIPRVTHKEVAERETAKGGKEYFTELCIEFTWVNAEKPEETIICPWYGQGLDSGEKGVGKAMTYAEKYFMLKFFNIATDKDDPDSFQKKMSDEPAKPYKESPSKAQKKTSAANNKPASSKPAETQPAGPEEMINEQAMKALHAIGKENNMDHEAVSFRAYIEYGADSLKSLTLKQARELYTKIKNGYAFVDGANQQAG